jgi:hypothetical protein
MGGRDLLSKSETLEKVMAKQIMYIGKKPTKRDNVNDVPDRVWRGLGDVQNVTDAEAIKLLLPAHADIWKDVTGLDDEKREEIVAQLREKHRAEERAVTPAGEIERALKTLSTSELEKELRRRRVADGKVDQNPAPAPSAPVNTQRSSTESTPENERPKNTDDVVQDIAGVIVTLDKENPAHYDSDGQPLFEAVLERIGYEISKSEFAAAVELIRG